MGSTSAGIKLERDWILKMIPTTTSGALQMIDEDDILVIVSRIAQRDLFVLYVKIEYIFSFVLR